MRRRPPQRQASIQVLILSDTHGYLDPQIMALAAHSHWILHAGDIGGAGVLTALTDPARQLVAIRGNNDRPNSWPDGDLPPLPEEALVDLPGGRVMLVHGHRQNPVSARHDKLRERYPEVRAVVYGHSHRLVCDQDRNPWILNPGAAGRARTYGGPSCILLHVRGDRWRLSPLRFSRCPSA